MDSTSPIKIKHALLIFTQWSYKDALIQTYTLPYVKIIRQAIPADKKIFLVTSEQEAISLSPEEIVQINNSWKEQNIELVAFPYRRFGIKKLLGFAAQVMRIFRLILANRVDVIHAFCTPAGGMAWVLSVLTGRKLVIDSFEPHAVAMVENGTWSKTGWAYRILFWLEKRQAQRATYIISATKGMRDFAKTTYGIDIGPKMFVKGACVDTTLFYPRPKDLQLASSLGLGDDKIVCVYAGKLGDIYYNEEVFSFLKAAHSYWGDRFRFLLLTNKKRAVLDAQLDQAGIPREVLVNQFVPHQDVPRYMSLADFGITPVKPVPSKRYCTPIKDGEYWAMGLPVVISPNISDDSEIIQQTGTGVVLDMADASAHQAALEQLDKLLNGTDKMALREKILHNAETYRSYSIPARIYPAIYA